jgi:hypothetical protein
MEWMAAHGDTYLQRFAASYMLSTDAWAFWKTDEPVWRKVADVGKTIGVGVAGVAAGSAFCGGTMWLGGWGCPIGAGMAAGAFTNVVGDSALDCFSDVCEFPGLDAETFWEVVEGMFVGGTGGALGHHGALLVNSSKSTAGLVAVYRSGTGFRVGATLVAEELLIQWGPRLARIIINQGFE